MNKIERLMNTIIILKAQPGIPVESLARILNISCRTTYRDFNTLALAGLPVHSSTGPHGGYYIDEHYFLPPLRFSGEEAASLIPGWKLSPSAERISLPEKHAPGSA